jgi:hypothetical protein
MASIISAGTTSGTALNMAGDTSGVLELATNGSTTAITIDTSQRAAFVAGTAALPAITTSGDTNTGIWFPAADTIAFAEGGAESMRIDSSGNVLVACTATPSASVKGLALRPFSSGVFATSAVNSTGSLTHYEFFNPNGQVGRIDTSGSATSYVTSSDYRLKDDIIPMTSALDKIAKLKPVSWKWKVDGTDGQGFIAHELQAVVPDAVVGEKDAVETYTDEDGIEQTKPKYQGIDTSFLVATLTAAIQEQQTIINDLKARITALEGAA